MRLRLDARELLSYRAHVGTSQFSLHSQLRLRFPVGDVTTTLSPELRALERDSTRVVKLDSSKDAPSTETKKTLSPETKKTLSPLMSKAAKTRIVGIRSTEIPYFDVALGSRV